MRGSLGRIMLDSRSKSHATEGRRYLTPHCAATFVVEEDEYKEPNKKTQRADESSNMNKTSNRRCSGGELSLNLLLYAVLRLTMSSGRLRQ